MGKISNLKIAIVISHPIQHFCPQYASFAKNPDITLKVFFGSALGYKKYLDVNFGKEISWSNLRLDLFNHVFLNGDAVLQADKNLDAANLEKEMTVYQPDLLFTYGYFQKLQKRAKHWATKNKVKIAYISDSELRHSRSLLKEFFKSFFLRNYFSGIDYFLSVGNANEAYYKKYGVPTDRIVRMGYPIDAQDYKCQYEQKPLLRKKLRDQYIISENEIVLAVVGKLVAWKNQDHIIDAMYLLEKKGLFVHLFIIGSGEKEMEWKKKAEGLTKSKVYFTGFIHIENLPSYYAATDIYVHPASLEPHSVAISEAIMMGCPVILSDRCGSYGSNDDVQEGQNGYVYPFGHIESLCEKIESLTRDGVKRARFGEYSHKIAVAFQDVSHYEVLEILLEKEKDAEVKERR